MSSLIERLKQECVTAYFAAEDSAQTLKGNFITYGCNAKESDTYHYLCSYHEDHYSRYNPLLPKDFRRLMHDKGGRRDQSLPNNQFYVLHYAVNQRAMRKKAKGMESFDPEFRADEWMEQFNRRFHNATVIWPFCTGNNRFLIPSILGEKELQQEALDWMKIGQEETFKLIGEISTNNLSVDHIRKEVSEIHLYDICGKPRETHFIL